MRSRDLTPLEMEVVMHIANGKRIGEIANLMHRSRSFVAKQANRARRKKDATTLAHLVSIVIASGQLEWTDEGRVLTSAQLDVGIAARAQK